MFVQPQLLSGFDRLTVLDPERLTNGTSDSVSALADNRPTSISRTESKPGTGFAAGHKLQQVAGKDFRELLAGTPFCFLFRRNKDLPRFRIDGTDQCPGWSPLEDCEDHRKQIILEIASVNRSRRYRTPGPAKRPRRRRRSDEEQKRARGELLRRRGSLDSAANSLKIECRVFLMSVAETPVLVPSVLSSVSGPSILRRWVASERSTGSASRRSRHRGSSGSKQTESCNRRQLGRRDLLFAALHGRECDPT